MFINKIVAVSILLILTIGIAQAQTLTIRVDTTRSVHPEFRKAAKLTVRQQIPEIVRRYGIDKVRIIPFGAMPWLSNGQEFMIPQRKEPICLEPKIPNEIKNIKSVVEVIERRAAEACQELRAKEEREYRTQLSATIESIQKALDNIKEEEATCTAIYDLLSMISMEGAGLTIVITDGKETCNKAILPLEAEWPQQHVLILLVPSSADWERVKSAITIFNEGKTKLGKSIPWARIEPPFMVDIASTFLRDQAKR